MRSVEAGYVALHVLEYLREWKDAEALARDLQITVNEAKALLKDLHKKRLVWRDGHKYIRRSGA